MPIKIIIRNSRPQPIAVRVQRPAWQQFLPY